MSMTREELAALRKRRAEFGGSILGASALRDVDALIAEVEESWRRLEQAEVEVERCEKEYLTAAFTHLTGGNLEMIGAMVEDMDKMRQRAEQAEQERDKWRELAESLRDENAGNAGAAAGCEQRAEQAERERDEALGNLESSREEWQTVGYLQERTIEALSQHLREAATAAAEYMQRALDAEEREKALRAALQVAKTHVDELAEAWRRGVLTEPPYDGGTRSNRNADVQHMLRGLLAEADTPAVPLGLTWTGEEWMFACGCALHPDDRNNTHGGAPHVHSERCPVHGVKG